MSVVPPSVTAEVSVAVSSTLTVPPTVPGTTSEASLISLLIQAADTSSSLTKRKDHPEGPEDEHLNQKVKKNEDVPDVGVQGQKDGNQQGQGQEQTQQGQVQGQQLGFHGVLVQGTDGNTYMHYPEQFQQQYMNMQFQMPTGADAAALPQLGDQSIHPQMLPIPAGMQNVQFDMFQHPQVVMEGNAMMNMIPNQSMIGMVPMGTMMFQAQEEPIGVPQQRKQRSKSGGYKRQELVRLLSDKTKYRTISDFVDWPEMKIVYFLPDWRILVHREENRKNGVSDNNFYQFNQNLLQNLGAQNVAAIVEPTPQSQIAPVANFTGNVAQSPAPGALPVNTISNTIPSQNASLNQPPCFPPLPGLPVGFDARNFAALPPQGIGAQEEKGDNAPKHLLKKKMNVSHGRYTQSQLTLPADACTYTLRQSRCSFRTCSACNTTSSTKSRNTSCRARGCRGGTFLLQACSVTTYYLFPTDPSDPRRLLVCIPDNGSEGHNHGPNDRSDRSSVSTGMLESLPALQTNFPFIQQLPTLNDLELRAPQGGNPVVESQTVPQFSEPYAFQTNEPNPAN